MMKKFYVPFIVLLFAVVLAYSQPIAPITEKAGNMTIMVDPRLELLCAVQLLSDYPTINRNTPYSKELIEYFQKDSALEAVLLTEELSTTYGFNSDAPIDLVLRLSNIPDLDQMHAFTARTIERAGSEANLEKYRLALEKFVADSDFEKFWNSKIPYYQKMVAYTADSLGDFDPSEVMSGYYNESMKSYNVILSPELTGGYGIRIPDENNELNIYGCLHTYKEYNGIPYFDKYGLSDFLYHEFSHSFINPLTDLYTSIVDSTESLFDPIKGKMSYDRWITCINEHIVRAARIRLLCATGHNKEAEVSLRNEHLYNFYYIDPVINKLKQFEQERDSKNITFTQFYPQLMAVFDSLLHTDNTDLINPIFTGTIGEVLGQRNVTIIYPTKGDDKASLKTLFDYTSKIKQYKGDGAKLLADTTALKTDLSDEWILAYGTIESNLFLDEYRSSFPFSIENDTIIADRKYVGENLRLITVFPNPQNPRRGMMINTATKNQSLKSVLINNSNIDYLVFEDINDVLQNGFYNKNGEWCF